MSDLKVRPGQPVSADRHNKIIDRLPSSESGFSAGGFQVNRTECLVKNSSGTNRDIGEFLSISGWNGPSGAEVYDVPKGVVYTAVDPVWHTSISRLVVLAHPIPDGETGRAVLSGQCIVKLGAASTDEDYVMIDPDALNEGLSSDTGIGRLLAKLSGGNYGMMNFRDASNIWRYEMNEDSQTPATTTCKLLRLDGDDFSAGNTIELEDPDGLMDDQVTGDKGWCILIGNKFYAIQAPC